MISAIQPLILPRWNFPFERMPQGRDQLPSLRVKSLNLRALRPWINKQLFRILGFDDEILQNLIVAHLDSNEFLNTIALYNDLVGFLGKTQSDSLIEALCTLIKEAEEHPEYAGIPPSLLMLTRNK